MIIIVLLSLTLMHVVNKATYLTKKEKEFIEFAIEMYVEYAEELEITAPEKHEYIVEQLNKIKDKKLKND